MRILFFGMQGTFSVPPFDVLQNSRHEVAAVIVPARRGQQTALAPLRPVPPVEDGLEIPLIRDGEEQSIVERAWQAGIAAFEVSRPHAREFVDQVSQWQPDVACVACFSRILPPALLAIPRHGFLNLHPSRLPHYRGPDPIFWQLRDGLNPLGVTVHWMDAALDTGDIAAQESVTYVDGMSWAEIERRCADVGARLLLDVVDALESGEAQRRAQGEGGSYQPAPTAADFVIPYTWTARRAFTFIRGTQVWGLPYTVETRGAPIRLARALAWTDESAVPGAVTGQDGFLLIEMADGTLIAEEA